MNQVRTALANARAGIRRRLEAVAAPLRQRWPNLRGASWRLPQRPLPADAAAVAARFGGGLRQARGMVQGLADRLPGGLRPWITLISLGFVMAVLMGNGRELLQLQPDGQGVLWLVLATGLTLASLLVNGLALGTLLAWLGWRPNWEAVVTLFVSTNLRKYLPGGIWHLAARVEALRAADAPLAAPLNTGSALLVTLLEPLLAATAALAWVVVGGWQNGLALVCLLPLALLLPGRLRRLLPVLEERRARALGLDPSPQEEADAALALPGYPWPPLLVQLGFVLVRFGGFVCCVWAFDLQGIIPWTTWFAGFALAWTAGLVVPGAPGGLGVFETVLLLRLRVALPDAQLLAVAFSYRLTSTLADMLGAALVGADQGLDGLLQRLAVGLPRPGLVWLKGLRPGRQAAEDAATLEPPPQPQQEAAPLPGWRRLLTRRESPAWLRRLQRRGENSDR